MPRSFWVGIACAAVLGTGAVAQTAHARAAAAQPAVRQRAAVKDPYAAEPLVVERLDTVYRYNADGTGSELETRVLRVQSQAGMRGALVTSLTYPASSRRKEIVYLRVRKPSGAVVDTPPSDAQEGPAPAAQIAPAYGDLRLLQIGARGLAVGDQVESQVRTVITQPEVGGQFWGTERFGQGNAVVLERSVELRVPASRNVLVRSPKFPPAMTSEGGEQVFRWTGSQLNPTSQSAGAGVAATNGGSSQDEQRTPPIAWTTFHNWAEVGEWYRGLAGTSAAPTPALKAKADQVVYGSKTADDKIRALYEYVSGEVRSIDVPLGLGQYAPHAAGEVLENLYGNSNDKNTVLMALLRAEGLTASAALVGGGADLDEEVPSPGWFDHVLTLTTDVQHGDVWLDTTPEVAPFRMLRAAYRDEFALVVPASGEASLRRTPAETPFAAFSRFEATGTLSASGALQAHVELTMRGDDELRYREGLTTAGPAQWDRVTEYFLRSGAIAGDGTNTTVDKLGDIAVPLHVSFDLRQASYGDWNDYRVEALEPGLDLPMTDRKTAPEHDIEFGGKRTETAISRLTLPKGFGADLPAAQHLHTEFGRLDKTYRLDKEGDAQVLVTERTLEITVDKLSATQWTAYRKFLDDLGDSEPWVQLTSAERPGAGAHGPPSAGMDSPSAAKLVEKADAAIEAKAYEEAISRLNEAKALNARQALLWSSYGVIAHRAGRLDEAVGDYRRELKDHPGESFVSELLASALTAENKDDEAIAALRDAVALHPADVRTVSMLARMLEKADEPGAEKALRDGLAAAPDSLELKLELGEFLVKTGKRDEGGLLLVTVATGSQDPRQLNDAAYALADTPVNLRVAESAARRAIQLLNTASLRQEGGSGGEVGLRRTAVLVATWDTYGWVLFREGNTSEAEPWLRAGWSDSYGAESGKHFAALLAKQGRAAEAERVQRLAAQGDRRVQVEEEPAAGPNRLRVGQDGGRGGPKGRALAGEHTFFVTGSGGAPAGNAIFELDYGLNTVPQVRFVGGDERLTGFAEALRKVDTHTLIPPGSPAHVLRRGVLHCLGAGNCMLEMLSTRAALEN